MPEGFAARVGDPVVHPMPLVLGPGPGSETTKIGFQPAWRGILAGAVPALQAASQIATKTIQTAVAATTAASGTPGAPAAKAAEQLAKTTLLTSMSAMITGAAAGADIHMCSTPSALPPHGPGVVIDGSKTVMIDSLPACRMGDTILEAIGPANKIAMGCPTVTIGG
jgi:uncharacterized Zn-binding protein involved in type VI secretion